MSTADLVRLTQAVRRLTRQHTVIVDDAAGRFIGTRDEAPLLDQLAAAKVGNQGSAEGGAGADPRSTPMNVSAVDLERAIERQYRRQFAAELTLAGKRRPEGFGAWDISSVVHRWSALVAAARVRGERTEDELIGAARMVERTVRSITDLLDPPYTFDLVDPCPTCRATVAVGRDGNGDLAPVKPLLVTERFPLAESHVDCRACGARWTGIHEARRLRVLLDEPLPTH